MAELAINCTDLGKRYRIGQQQRYKALRDVLAEAAISPFRRMRAAISRNGHSVNDLQFSNHIWALQDVSFDVKSGEVLGIIGRNGAGKSTLLKILSRITKPTRGHVTIHGRIASLLEVGTGFHPELTGRENLYLSGAVLGMKKTEIEKKFDQIVDFAEIDKFIDTPVKRYSSGMQMRLAFAVAAHLEPEILLVDEVLAVGDFEFQKKCLGRMQDIGESGRTVLFVSHSMPTVQRLCQRGILLVKGSVAADGPVNDVVNEYLTTNMTSRHVGTVIDGKVTITEATIMWAQSDGLRLEVNFVSPFMLCPPMLGLVIYDAMGAPVFGTNPRFDVHAHQPRSMKAGTITVKISTEALRPDTYHVSLWLGDQYQDYSIVDRALYVEIGTGAQEAWRPPRDVIGNIRLDTEWSYQIHDSHRSEQLEPI
ncbi:MAG TPA: ABC transporter ATP-binding protein [Pyrinomonadaceae bacterium]|nr:ABC transporter ATP-binding protein [Pyrinomonadaceae bacterium]